MEQINEYDKILLSVLTLLFGGIFAMIMRLAYKINAHQRVLDQLSGQLTNLPAAAELVVRKIIEGHEERELEKFDQIQAKLENVRLEVVSLKK